jgi:hypothetical protein
LRGVLRAAGLDLDDRFFVVDVAAEGVAVQALATPAS